MTVRPSKTRDPDGRVMPNPLSRASRPSAASTPSPSPMRDATAPTMSASASTERNTWRRLAPTMRSSASSRVRWPTVMEKVLKMVKPPDEQGDEGEDQEGGGEEGEGVIDVVGLLVRHGLAGHHLDPLGERGRDGVFDGLLVRTRRGQDVDGVVASLLTEEALGGRQVEGGDGGAGQVVRRAERHDPADGERLGRAGQEHPHLVADGEVVLLRRPGVHHHLVRRRRGRTRRQLEGRQLAIGVVGHAQRRGSTVADRLPSGARRTGRSR